MIWMGATPFPSDRRLMPNSTEFMSERLLPRDTVLTPTPPLAMPFTLYRVSPILWLNLALPVRSSWTGTVSPKYQRIMSSRSADVI